MREREAAKRSLRESQRISKTSPIERRLGSSMTRRKRLIQISELFAVIAKHHARNRIIIKLNIIKLSIANGQKLNSVSHRFFFKDRLRTVRRESFEENLFKRLFDGII